MEALNDLISKAEDLQLFTPLGPRVIKMRASLYANCMVVFLHPSERDVQIMRNILELFALASGLHTNVQKCQF